ADYLHDYIVDVVSESDSSGGGGRVVHAYDYKGTPAWHYADDDGLLTDDQKTWSQWRGYGTVAESTGDPGEQTSTESLYFRGMNGDHLPTGTRAVSVTDSQNTSVPDENAYAGMVRESRTFNGPGGAEVSAAVYDPWQSAPTATRTIGAVTVNARFAGTEGTHTRTTLDNGRGVRRTYVKTTFDAYG